MSPEPLHTHVCLLAWENRREMSWFEQELCVCFCSIPEFGYLFAHVCLWSAWDGV